MKRARMKVHSEKMATRNKEKTKKIAMMTPKMKKARTKAVARKAKMTWMTLTRMNLRVPQKKTILTVSSFLINLTPSRRVSERESSSRRRRRKITEMSIRLSIRRETRRRVVRPTNRSSRINHSPWSNRRS